MEKAKQITFQTIKNSNLEMTILKMNGTLMLSLALWILSMVSN